MKVVLLAGGRGTRFAEETTVRPKPMIEIGGMPILAHLMHLYGAFGYQDFIVACGYKGDIIKSYFAEFGIRQTDWCLDLRTGKRSILNSTLPDWRIAAVDTGQETMTGGRIRRLMPLLENETFMVTYGDGLADLDIRQLVRFHQSHDRLATVTAVRPPARFGCLVLENNRVEAFLEKPQAQGGWINGGFFVFDAGVFDYLKDDQTVLEKEPLERLARDGQLAAFRHHGFWQPMDTLREKQLLERLWESGEAPWKVWNEHDDSAPILSGSPGDGHGADRVQGSVARRVA